MARSPRRLRELIFAGIKLRERNAFSDAGIEIDAVAPSSPRGTRVLAEILNLLGPGLTAHMTYYETSAGAKVFLGRRLHARRLGAAADGQAAAREPLARGWPARAWTLRPCLSSIVPATWRARWASSRGRPRWHERGGCLIDVRQRPRSPAIVLAHLAGATVITIASPVLIGISDSTTTAAAATSRRAAGAYGWPVKPFDRPHPVRANFGDPRISFAGPPTQATVMYGRGAFMFHFGIDIAVPDGTPVYPVHSGTVGVRDEENVLVDGDGMHTQYWHLVVAVRPGQHVVAYRTVLGRVLKGYEHVHFAQLEGGQKVNLLTGDRLAPTRTPPSRASPRSRSAQARRRTSSTPRRSPAA